MRGSLTFIPKVGAYTYMCYIYVYYTKLRSFKIY